MVRLKFEDVEKPLPRPKKTSKEPQQKKPRKFTDKDFDSEEEYGREKQEDESDVEYDDGKGENDSDVEYDDGKGSGEASMQSSEEIVSLSNQESDSEEEAEAEMTENNDKASDDSYIFEKQD